ncbi:MAG: WYL domain-containing protein [bacterium]|nr:WYL domain-containing protein [bacterium]
MNSRTETQVLERCLRILRFLCTNRKATINQLYYLFDRKVSRRTLERDMVRLSMANIPLESVYENGRELTWKLAPHFRDYFPKLLCDDEIAAVLLLDELAKIVEYTPWAEGVEQLRDRMKELFPIEVIDPRQNSLNDTFYIAQNGRVDLRPFTKQIRNFTEAVKRSIRIHIVYKKPTQQSVNRYLAEPYGILLFREALYAIVWDVLQERYLTLPFHRMEEVELLPSQTFKRNPNFKLQQILNDRFGILGHNSKLVSDVTMRFYPPVAQVIAERMWHPSQMITKENDNTVKLTFRVQLTDELVAWIMRWQKYVEVLEPQHFREWMVKVLKETLARYT